MAIKKLTGDLAQTSVGSNISFTGTTTVSSTSVTSVSSTTGLIVGQVVSGTGITAGTTIAAIGTGTITLSAAATGAGTGTIIAAAEMQVIGLSDWSLSWKQKTVDATTTDDSAYESSLPSSKSWTVKAKYIFYDGDTSQTAAILATITNPNTPAQWNFFPDAENSDMCFVGTAYVDGIDMGAGVGKIIGLDVSLKGTGILNVGTQSAPVVNPNTITGEQAEV